MSTVKTACTAPAGPPASPLDLKRSGSRFVPVTWESPIAHSTVAGEDSICTGLSRWKRAMSTSPGPAKGSARTRTTARKAVSPHTASRSRRRARSHSRMPGSRTAGNSFVIVARPSTVSPRTGRSATTSARAASMSATASASKCVRRDAPMRIGWATSSQATSSPRPAGEARRAELRHERADEHDRAEPERRRHGEHRQRRQRRVLEPEVAEGQRPVAHEVRVAGVHEEVVHPDVGERPRRRQQDPQRRVRDVRRDPADPST